QIDRDHEVELGERSIETRSVRSRQDRIAREGDEGTDASVSFRVDLLGEGRGGKLAAEFRQAAHPALPHAEMTAIAGAASEIDQIGGRDRKSTRLNSSH